MGETVPIDQIARSKEFEQKRIEAVHRTALLDTEPDIEFDQLIQLAALICGTPMGMFTLVDSERQWYKSSIGLGTRETTRAVSFCSRAIEQPSLFIVEDATVDVRFANNPLVTDVPKIRFYAGMPLAGPDGFFVGTLCVADIIPRQLTVLQKAALETLAVQVEARMQLLQQRRELEVLVQTKDKLLHELQSSETRFRTFMDNSPVLSYIKERDGTFIFYNKKLADRFHIDRNAWIGKSVSDIWPGEASDRIRANDLEAMDGAVPIEKSEETLEADGTLSCWKSYKFPWWNDKGQLLLGGFSIDVTEGIARQKALEDANKRLAELATVDVLTGLLNRRLLDTQVDQQFEIARLQHASLSIVMLDIDSFKLRNDTYGHAAGDHLLRQLSKLILHTMRASDVAGRYGGEEFVILLPQADEVGAMLFSERLLEAMHAEVWLNGPVTASLGIATIASATTSGKQLLGFADDAMYKAKRAGKDRIVTHQYVVAAE